MPNFWYCNDLEFYGHLPELEKKLKNIACRHLFYAQPGDILYLPHFEDSIFPGFTDYVWGLKKIPDGNITILKEPSNKTLSDYDLRTYIQTHQANQAAQAMGLRLVETPAHLVSSGLIEKLNDKLFFKTVSEQLGVKTPPGAVVHNLVDLKYFIQSISSKDHGHVFLRKTHLGGGVGNLFGQSDKVLEQVHDWYDGGTVLVEYELELEATLGSLFYIGEKTTEFLGTDKQIIENGKWVGFYFPYENEKIADQIRELSLIYAKYFHALGARGMANIDWGILAKDHPEIGMKKGEIIAFECNFRMNAINHLLKFARDVFGSDFSKIKMMGREDCALKNPKMSFVELLEKFKGTPNLIITNPPRGGKFSYCLLYSSEKELHHNVTRLTEVTA